MTYKLAGVACLGARTSGSAFLVPFFRCRTSNHHFAQDLDADRRIVAFLQFDPFRYHTIVDGLPAHDRVLGDVGLMAVRLDDLILVAEAPDVIDHLTSLRLKDHKAPFFEIDACLLTGQWPELPGAIRRATKILGDKAVAKSWERAEMRALHRMVRRNDGNSIEGEFRDLLANLSEPRWVKRWLTLWQSYPDRDAMIALGLQYVADPVPRITPKGRVLSHLLSTRRLAQTITVQRAALDWLGAAVELTPADPAIGKIWLALAAAGLPLHDEMFDRGIKFVQAAAWSDTPPSKWPNVWATLWDVAKQARPDDTGRLRHIAHMALWDKAHIPRAARLAVQALKPVANEPIVQDILYSWVCANQPHTNAWIDAYLQIAAIRMSKQLAESAACWLETEPGRLRRWADVFESILDQQLTETDLFELGNDWLKRANPALTTWPRVAQFIFSQSADPLVERLVKQWIASHPENPAAWALSLRITDLEERRLLHGQI